MNKSLPIAALLAASTFAAASASANSIITDSAASQTQVHATNTGANATNSGSFVDILGGNFDTDSATITFGANTGGTVTFTLRTKYNGAPPAGVTPGVRYADLFIDTDKLANGDSSFRYEYAIPLVDHDGFSKNRLYSVTSTKSSQDFFGAGSGASTGYQYGGAYRTPDGIYRGLVPVSLLSGAEVANATVTQASVGPVGGYYDITLAVAGWAQGIGDYDFNVLWGTGTCANDTVWGTAAVPLPPALPMFLAALAGLGLVSRRNAN